jgi:hypothetical protein
MKKFLQSVVLVLALILAIILEILTKVVKWKHPVYESISLTITEWKEQMRHIVKKIYWPEVFVYFASIFMIVAIYYYFIDNHLKLMISATISVMILSFAFVLDTRPTYQVTGGYKKFIHIGIILFVIIVLFSSCSRGQCPTTNKNYFMRAVPKSKPLYKGYKSQKAYIVPYKYRRKISNYGKIK